MLAVVLAVSGGGHALDGLKYFCEVVIIAEAYPFRHGGDGDILPQQQALCRLDPALGDQAGDAAVPGELFGHGAELGGAHVQIPGNLLQIGVAAVIVLIVIVPLKKAANKLL